MSDSFQDLDQEIIHGNNFRSNLDKRSPASTSLSSVKASVLVQEISDESASRRSSKRASHKDAKWRRESV